MPGLVLYILGAPPLPLPPPTHPQGPRYLTGDRVPDRPIHPSVQRPVWPNQSAESIRCVDGRSRILYRGWRIY